VQERTPIAVECVSDGASAADHRGVLRPPIGLGTWGLSGSWQRRPLPVVPSAFVLKVRARQFPGVVQYLLTWAVSP
jgi:hypothetical protein